MNDKRVAFTLETSSALEAGASGGARVDRDRPGAPLAREHFNRSSRRSGGARCVAVPATIAVLDGVIRIGLEENELTKIAASSSHVQGCTRDGGPRQAGAPAIVDFIKANRRDLAAIMAKGLSAATTVSATLWIARRFGLEPMVMATGGLGGVHRDASTTFDFSTDLDELARADGAVVVCSGLKSILDVSATLEALETRGVLVVGYRTDVLPGFLAQSSGLALEHRVDTPAEAASIVRAHRALHLPGTIVLTQTVPGEHALDCGELQAALDKAVQGRSGPADRGQTAHAVFAQLDPAIDHGRG